MQRQTSPKAAQGGTDFAMLPSAHRKPERRDSKAFKMETQFNTGRAWFLSVALLLGTLGFVLVDHQSRTANLRGHLHEKHARANEAMKQWSEEAKGQMQGRRPASIVPRAAVAARRPTIDPRAELSQRAAQTPAHMSTLEAILARMTARPTEKDVAEAERLQKVMVGAD